MNSITALHSLMALACVEVRVAAGQRLICEKKKAEQQRALIWEWGWRMSLEELI